MSAESLFVNIFLFVSQLSIDLHASIPWSRNVSSEMCQVSFLNYILGIVHLSILYFSGCRVTVQINPMTSQLIVSRFCLHFRRGHRMLHFLEEACRLWGIADRRMFSMRLGQLSMAALRNVRKNIRVPVPIRPIVTVTYHSTHNSPAFRVSLSPSIQRQLWRVCDLYALSDSALWQRTLATVRHETEAEALIQDLPSDDEEY